MKAEEAAQAEFAEWGATALTPFAFDGSLSYSMSMPLAPVEPVKCDKRCQKDKLKNRQRRRLSEAASMSMSLSLSADFEWVEQDLTVFEFASDSSLSMSVPAEPVKCDKRCQKDKLQRRRLSEDASMSMMNMSLSTDLEWAEPDFEFAGDGSLSLSMSAP